MLDQAFLWRLLDLTESDGRPIDLVLATKFPSYVVRHPNKRVWVLHQFRQAYELDRTDLGQFSEEPQDRALRRSVQNLDRVALGEAKRLFATSRNVADRIERSTGLAAEVLPHPPQELAYRNDGYGDFVLSVGRLDRAKRNDLLLEAAALDPGLRVVIAGEGPDRDRLEALAAERGLNGRAEFTGRVDEAELASLYARCLAVYYAPVDEDFGMVPYEAFLSEKPVLTTTDAGGPLEVVTDGRTGYVPRPIRPSSPRRRPPARAPRRGGGVRSRGQGARLPCHVGRLHRDTALVKVAYYSPMPPERSGIADYSAHLLPALRERIDVEVVKRGRTRPVTGH